MAQYFAHLEDLKSVVGETSDEYIAAAQRKLDVMVNPHSVTAKFRNIISNNAMIESSWFMLGLLDRALEDKRGTIRKLQEEMALLDSQNEQLVTEKQATDTKLRRQLAEMEEAKGRIHKLMEENQALVCENERLDAELEEARNYLAEVTSHNLRLRWELEARQGRSDNISMHTAGEEGDVQDSQGESEGQGEVEVVSALQKLAIDAAPRDMGDFCEPVWI